jgi:hypothetical protein
MSSGIETMTVWGERLEIFMAENLRCAIYLFICGLLNKCFFSSSEYEVLNERMIDEQ